MIPYPAKVVAVFAFPLTVSVKVSKALLESGLFDAAVILDRGENVGKVREIIRTGGEKNEDFGNSFDCDRNLHYG